MTKENQRSKLLVRIGGQAGQGLETVGQMLAKALVRSGYEILTTQSAMSRIRGGHNYFSVLISLDPLLGPEEEIDLLVAFTDETIALHKEFVNKQGLIVSGEDTKEHGAANSLKVPYQRLAKDKIVSNVVALGVISCLIGLEEKIVSQVIEDAIGKKHQEMISKNLDALHKGIEWTRGQSPDFRSLPGPTTSQSKLTMNGNQAIALGALAGGVNFCSFYPMTPATGVALNLISQAEELGVVCEQAEDEIAAINMALGASFCGAKSIVPTSGGGFALMGEGLSLAGMTETPVVVVLAQRPSPATGLPTRTEQADLELALGTGHGEFPRAILAPGSPDECFYLTSKALSLAERYQGPIIVMTDQYLADSIRSVKRFDFNAVSVTDQTQKNIKGHEKYERFAWSGNGVSPRLIPGTGPHLVVADSDEHTPDGHITEDHQVRTRMVNKRMKKMDGLLQEVIPPVYQGDNKPEMLLLTWGSSRGAVQQAAEILRSKGRSVASLSFSQVWPLKPSQFEEHLRQAGSIVAVESNATGQLARLIKRETGFGPHVQVLKYDGLPLTSEYILHELSK